MTIAIPCADGELTSDVFVRFGRAPGFLLIDSVAAGAPTRYITNSVSLQAAQGAGIQSAQRLADLGVDVALLMNCGPKALRVLSAAGVAVHTCPAGTVGEALAAYRDGKLSRMDAPTVEGHW